MYDAVIFKFRCMDPSMTESASQYTIALKEDMFREEKCGLESISFERVKEGETQ